MDYAQEHTVDPFYLKAIQLAGKEPEQGLTNEEARVWVDSLYAQSCEHSGIKAFLKYKDFLEELRLKVHRKAAIYGYKQVKDDRMIEVALDLLEAGYGIEQILDDMELFFVAYNIKLSGRN